MKYLFVFLLCFTGVLRAQDSSSLLVQATDDLKNDRFVEALAAAIAAAKIEPGNYQAHYYVALADLNLDQIEAAAAAAQQALDLAPAAAKPAVGKLVTLIQGRRQSADGSSMDADGKAAQAALNDGSKAKAARLFDQAWNVGQGNPDYALKAADLYANTLGQPIDAARLLREVRLKFPNTPYAERAAAQLAGMAVELRRTAVKFLLESGRTAKTEEAFRAAVAKAADADPGFVLPYLWRVQMESQWDLGAGENLKAAVQDLARHDLASIEILSALPNIKSRLSNPEFAGFLKDIIGQKDFATLEIQTRYYDTQILFRLPESDEINSASDVQNGQPIRIVTDVPCEKISLDGYGWATKNSSLLVFGVKSGDHELEVSTHGNPAYKTAIKSETGNKGVVFQYKFAELAKKDVPCEKCHGDGEVKEWRDCDYCGGSGKITCSACEGRGKFYFTEDHGSGYTSTHTRRCQDCRGTGKVACDECRGAGRFSSNVTCPQCAGAGYFSRLQLAAR